MSDYRRSIVPGGCYFFTVVTHARRPLFASAENIERLRDGFRHVMAKHPFQVDAIVLLPDHLHCIWQLPQDDADYSKRWRLTKHYLTRGVTAEVNHRGEKKVWQRRFWEHVIRDDEDWRRHLDYIHYNPVKHGYVERPIDWALSSFRRAMRKGWYDKDWGLKEAVTISGMDLE